jgi:hypothetical protein
MKNNKGITLIVLILTIIVLVILACISLSLVINNDNFLTQTSNNSIVSSESNIEETKNAKDEYTYSSEISEPNSSSRSGMTNSNSKSEYIGSFVNLNINYTNVNGSFDYNPSYLQGNWDNNGQTGWRILDYDENITLISAGSPLTYYFATNTDSDATNSKLNNIKTKIKLVSDSTEGFMKNGFENNNLENIFSAEYIDSVSCFSTDDFLKIYKYLSGKNDATLTSIYNNQNSFPLRTSTLQSLANNKMTDKTIDLINNGFFYLFSGDLIYSVISSGGRGTIYGYIIYNNTSSGYLNTNLEGEFSVRVVVKLNKNVTLADGDGTQDNPYQIKY